MEASGGFTVIVCLLPPCTSAQNSRGKALANIRPNMKTLIAIFCLTFTGCYTKAIVVDPIAPAVTQARADVAASNASSARLEGSVQIIHTKTTDIAANITTVTEEADRLRAQGSASAAELEKQWRDLVGIRTRTSILEADTLAASRNAAEQRVLRDTAHERLNELSTAAVANDKGVEKLKTQIVKQAANAALGKSVKWLIGIALISAVVLALLFVIFRTIKPL